MSIYRSLHEGWTLTSASRLDLGEIPATIPGCVHTDLLAAALIDDPYLDDNETATTWIGRTPWTYRTSFDWQPAGHERVDLVCDGLDTVASVSVNGVIVGRSANMHRSYRFAVTHLLVPGKNSLVVHFDSPYHYAERHQAVLGDRPGAYAEPYPFIRKMACNFGWDWGPTLVTSGIWRPIGIHSWSTARLAEVRPLTVLSHGTWRVNVHVRVERTRPDAPLEVVASLSGPGIAGVDVPLTLGPGESAGVLSIPVADPELWWPRGHGAQPVYRLTVGLENDVWSREIGFRTVDIDTTSDEDGSAFVLRVNGKPIFVKGFNWIPDDCFPTRVTVERLSQRFDQAVEAGANALRVWGGGLYESEDFYQLADRLGLLVWQDFPFACAAYPEEEPLWGEVEEEARLQVARLSSHPSLAIWCGNNENFVGYHHWDWPDKLGGRSWGYRFYHELLPQIVSELDPTRPYWPGSPYSGAPNLDTEDPSRGNVHIWTVWGKEDYTHYAQYTPRFVSEFGFQGPPTYATLRRSVSDGPLTVGSSHQKAPDGQGKLLRGLAKHLPMPETFDDWHYYTQLNQARALAFGVERFRALAPYCMGAIVWQLNDCWPVNSWSAVDGDGRRKPLWYALRRAFAPRILTFQEDTVVAVNDTDETWAGELVLTRHTIAGEVVARECASIAVAPRSVARLALPAAIQVPGRPAEELIVAQAAGVRAMRFFAEDLDVQYRPADLDVKAQRVDGGVRVDVAARTLVRELAIFPDRLDAGATIDDQLVTLLPGETATFLVQTDKELDLTALTTYPVLRCVNEGSGWPAPGVVGRAGCDSPPPVRNPASDE